MDVYKELCGSTSVCPIKISALSLFTDSSVCLSWLQSYSAEFDKMNNSSVFVKNRLHRIAQLCEAFPVKFGFCAGKENPADYITRSFSYRLISQSNYISGPACDPECLSTSGDIPCVIIPNPSLHGDRDNYTQLSTAIDIGVCEDSVFDLRRFSTFSRYVTACQAVLTYINK